MLHGPPADLTGIVSTLTNCLTDVLGPLVRREALAVERQ